MTNKSILIVSAPSINAPLFRWGLLSKFDNQVGHLRRYSMNSISKLLNELGLEIIEKIKAEGVLRNILFTNRFFELIIKMTRFKIVNDLIQCLDELTVPIFGESL